MAKTLQLALVSLCIAAVATAMPSDQLDANVVTPPAPEAQITYEQYVSMPVEERQVLVELLAADNSNTSVGASSPWKWLKCKICKKGMSLFEGKVASEGCGLADSFAVSVCEAAGLGPEDPLADVCAAAFVAGCSAIAKDIEGHITDKDKLCKDIHMC